MYKFIYTLLILFSGCYLSAQALQGTVVDRSGKPISDALIHIGENHCHSDVSGKFVLKNCVAGDTLFISLLGYKTLKRTLEPSDFEKEVVFRMEEAIFDLSQVTVSGAVKNVNVVAAIDLQTDPVTSSQEILRRVPGILIGQHAGGGKAEQIFLRGFDIDHGTDIGISVDGMPVNMVSHAHGQGYADLHFLIPETIETIDFGKGPYYADQGNFNTAGYVNFKTKDKLDTSSFGMEYGQFNTFRTFGLFDLLEREENQHAYVATEYIMTDGPVESPQNFNRLNLMGKYSLQLNGGEQFSVLISRMQSKWDASGQIPQRLVDDGTISRFGSVDDTEGGNTSRTNIALNHTKVIDEKTFMKTSAFYSNYDFELFSNFTFFLEDPVNGDQIQQKENRNIYGLNTTLFQNFTAGEMDIELSYGFGLRYDDVNGDQLSHTRNRKEILERLSLGDVDETNFNGFINAEFDFGKWLINPGLRVDVLNFDYANQLSTTYDNRSVSKGILLPKLNVIYNPEANLQLYIKSGMGFHSNDTRVVVDRNGKEILPAAYGVDVGFIWKPVPRLWLNAAAWYLFLQQEFVYVGDAGIIEPSGKTKRQGLDFGLRYQLTDYLFFDTDLTYTHARAINEKEGSDYIPLAVDLMAAGGLAFKHPSGFSAGLRYRYIKDRPANEDNSIVAPGYFIADANISYRIKNITLGLAIENLFDEDWNEAQFATESRLLDEVNPVEEIHFTPGVPFFVRGNVKYNF